MNRYGQFLQGRYNRVRDAGASHRDFVIANDLSDEVARELE